METSVTTSNNTTMTIQGREKKAKSEDDHEYEDDDASIKRIKIRTGSKQDLLDLPTGSTQSVMYSKFSQRSKRSPFETSSSNLKINEGKINI